MLSINLALDWSPNTIHAGFYIAFLKGWYKDNEIDLNIINPEEDNYKLTPAKQLANGTAHFAIAPTESVISYRTLSTSAPLIAVAAILQEDTSAIVSLKSSGIKTPKDLDGKIYASYGARYEECIVKKMIQNGGGCGMLQVSNPDKLGIWDTLLDGKAAATWVFMPWEGVIAKHQNIELDVFKLGDYNIPYGYSPLLITREDVLEDYPDCVRTFLKVTAAGFDYVAKNPTKSALFLNKELNHPNFKNLALIEESLKMLSGKWLSGSSWGLMNDEVWGSFMDWLVNNKVLCNLDGEVIEDLQMNIQDMYTNSYLL